MENIKEKYMEKNFNNIIDIFKMVWYYTINFNIKTKVSYIV